MNRIVRWLEDYVLPLANRIGQVGRLEGCICFINADHHGGVSGSFD